MTLAKKNLSFKNKVLLENRVSGGLPVSTPLLKTPQLRAHYLSCPMSLVKSSLSLTKPWTWSLMSCVTMSNLALRSADILLRLSLTLSSTLGQSYISQVLQTLYRNFKLRPFEMLALCGSHIMA